MKSRPRFILMLMKPPCRSVFGGKDPRGLGGSISCDFYNMADRQARELAEILQRAQSLAQRIGSAGVPVARYSTTSAAASASTTLFASSLRQSSTSSPAEPNSSNPVRPASATASRATEDQNSSILGNYRRLFAPYQRNSYPQHTRNTNARGNAKRKNETWTHDFFCLSSVDQAFAPNQRLRLELHEAGLGRKKVVFNSSGDAKHMKDRLEESFPKLKECGGFEILRPQGRIDPLKTIAPPRSGYSVPFLRDQSSLGTAIAYIRPIQKDLDLSLITPVDTQVSVILCLVKIFDRNIKVGNTLME